jgi:short-subunit dehydrogenase
VALVARNAEELAAARQTLVGDGVPEGDVLTVVADVGVRAEAERAVREASAKFGRVDVLVNNAAILQVGPVEQQTVENFEETARVNYLAMVYTTFAALPQMLEQGSGRIVNIASMGGCLPVPHMLPYTASKFAAVGFSRGLHAELRGKGVRVTTVTPGMMRTGSIPQVKLVGDAAAERAWFERGARLASVSAECAARRIVRAAARGRAETSVALPALVLTRLAGVVPGVVARISAWVNEDLLPKATHRRGR